MERLRELLSQASLWCLLNQYLIASIICFLVAGALLATLLAIN
jgi:hypothetical protein